jgi:tetratricopeptide (TPR) repeat protein
MLKKTCFCLSLPLLISIFALAPSSGDDFPGKGDRFAWSNALPYYNLANKYLEHSRYEEAKTNFEEAIYRYEYDPDFFINYGVALRKLESYKAAEEAFKKALELRSNDWQAWSDLANAYLKQNKLKDTIACFQQAMKVQPPPPPQEKEAMLKDIADINKILAMQAPAPGQAKPGGKPDPDTDATEEKPAKTGVNQKGTRKKAGNNSGIRCTGKTPGAESQTISSDPPAQMSKQELKKTGWDWVQ